MIMMMISGGFLGFFLPVWAILKLRELDDDDNFVISASFMFSISIDICFFLFQTCTAVHFVKCSWVTCVQSGRRELLFSYSSS